MSKLFPMIITRFLERCTRRFYGSVHVCSTYSYDNIMITDIILTLPLEDKSVFAVITTSYSNII